MTSITVGQFKAQFSSLLEKVLKGEEIVISYGKLKEKVAILSPYSKHLKSKKRKLGLLQGKASFKIKNDFKISEEDFLNL